jgi:phenol hydroxylase P1 protein
VELYDRRRTRIQMKDWYAFKDPRQFYYGSYTIARSRQQDALEKNIEFVEKRGLLRDLPAPVRSKLAFVTVPLRHLEWGANTNNCYITAYGWGAAITQATMFQTMDRLGIAQYLSRIGLLLDGNSGELLTHGRTLWMEHAAWQGLRSHVERLMVTRDWFELFVAQNLVLDGFVYPLIFQKYEARFAAKHGPALSLITEFMSSWYADTARWVDATVRTAASESQANAHLLREWVHEWSQATREALALYAAEVFNEDAATVLTDVSTAFDSRVAKLDLSP